MSSPARSARRHALAASWVAAALLAVTPHATAAEAGPARTGSATTPLLAWPDGAPSPDFRLGDERGEPRSLADYRGRIAIVTFGYANCPAACSLELQTLANAMRLLGPDADGVAVVFITLDPQRDSQAALGRFVRRFDPRFIGLRGSAAQTDEATRRFSVENARVAAGGDYLIDHPIETFVFDRIGRLRLVGGAASSAQDVAEGVRALLDTPSAGPGAPERPSGRDGS